MFIKLLILSHFSIYPQVYKILNEAENNILVHNYLNANSLYKKAFTLTKGDVSYNNLYNMLLCSAKCKDSIFAQKIITTLRKRGIDKLPLDDINVLLVIEKEWIEKYYKQSKTIVSKESKFKNIIDSLVINDQLINKSARDRNNGELDIVGHNSMDSITNINLEAIAKILKGRSFTYTNFGNKDWDMAYTIFIHNAQGENKMTTYTNEFYTLVKKNKFPPKLLEFLISQKARDVGKEMNVNFKNFCLNVPLNPYQYITINDSLFVYGIVDSVKIQKCNKDKNKLVGTEDVNIMHQKIIYQFYNKGWVFYPFDYITKFPVEMIRPKFRKNLHYIPNNIK